MKSVTERDRRNSKTLPERIRDAAQEVLEGIRVLVEPEPALVPIPVRRPPRGRRR